MSRRESRMLIDLESIGNSYGLVSCDLKTNAKLKILSPEYAVLELWIEEEPNIKGDM